MALNIMIFAGILSSINMGTGLNMELSRKTSLFGLKVWVLMGVIVGMFIVVILLVLSLCLTLRKKSRKVGQLLPFNQITAASQEMKDIQIDQASPNKFGSPNRELLAHDALSGRDPEKMFKPNDGDNKGHPILSNDESKDNSHQNGKEKSSLAGSPTSVSSPLSGLPEFSQLGWGHWFTLRDLQLATNYFAKESIVGEGGYGIVYQGHLINGSPVAVKKLLNNQGQAEREFKVEVEAIGHVRHKNLVRLLGYCIEGTQRLLVYEYVGNGNLEQWLHGAMQQHGYLTWEARMKILLGTAKALEYLHEGIEPKVVHRDIKSSNILIDEDFNAKLSDFGLAKLLGAGKSHISTRVMGTFGYVAPEYASSGLLNEKSDVYSFGILILEVITGRDPVDHGRPQHEVNMIDWLKTMVGSRRSEEVLDPNISTRPTTSALKRALLTALRCVDPDTQKRPKMGQVVRMLESEEYPLPREDRRRRKSQADNKAGTEKENSDKVGIAGH